eukprot:SAG11_NODE_1959_length_3999_cov_1.662308_3_plen_138_part_00
MCCTGLISMDASCSMLMKMMPPTPNTQFIPNESHIEASVGGPSLRAVPATRKEKSAAHRTVTVAASDEKVSPVVEVVAASPSWSFRLLENTAVARSSVPKRAVGGDLPNLTRPIIISRASNLLILISLLIPPTLFVS